MTRPRQVPSVESDEQRQPEQPGPTPPESRGRISRAGAAVGRAPARMGRGIRRLAEGIPASFVAALAALVLVAILYTVAAREPKEFRGYAEFTMSPRGCTVDARQQFNATICQRVARGVYRVTFRKSLKGSTVLASRGSCCPGPISASIESDRNVLIVIGRRARGPVRATVLVP